jgi:putative FmdB family regulatory protein
MPIYEYQCTECNHEFEVMQKMSDKPVEKCVKCSGRVEKLISQSSFALKGTGWYQTDYADKGASNKEKKCETVSEKCAGCPSAS